MTDSMWESEHMPPPMWRNRDPQPAPEPEPSPPQQHYLTAITLTVRGTSYLLACRCGWLASAPELHVGGYWEKHRRGEPIEHG